MFAVWSWTNTSTSLSLYFCICKKLTPKSQSAFQDDVRFCLCQHCAALSNDITGSMEPPRWSSILHNGFLHIWWQLLCFRVEQDYPQTWGISTLLSPLCLKARAVGRWLWLVGAGYTQLIPNSEFRDVMLLTWSQPYWEYLHMARGCNGSIYTTALHDRVPSIYS